MAVVAGIFKASDGLPKDGATCKLWTLAQFGGTHPAKDTALPVTAAVQTLSGGTGVAYGGNGHYRFTGVTSGDYVVSVEWNGARVYDAFTIEASSGTDVKTYGATGNGTTDDTSAIQAALNDTANGHLLFPPGTYKVQTLSIPSRTGLVIEGEGATLLMSGTGSSSAPQGLALSGTCRDITIRNLRFLGDGVAANYHAGFKIPNAVTISGLRIENCHFETLTCGIFAVRTASGAWTDITIDSCEFEDIIGTGAGQGRGIYWSTGSLEPQGLVVRSCDFEDTDLHSVHVANGTGIEVASCTFRNHRNALASGATLPDVLVAAGSNIVIERNRFFAGSDGAIAVAPTGATIARVRIVGNQIKSPLQNVADITVGSVDPDDSLGGGTGGTIEDFLIEGNEVYKSGVDAPFILVNSGLEGIIAGNRAQMLSVTAANTPVIRLLGADETAGTSGYTDDLLVTGNQAVVTLSGGSVNGIEFGSALCASGAQLRIVNNWFYGVTAYFRSVASIQNDNLFVDALSIGAANLGLTFDASSYLMEGTLGPVNLTGGMRLGSPKRITANTSLRPWETFVIVTTGASNVTVTLPAISAARSATDVADGTVIVITKADVGAGVVLLDAAGTELILWAGATGAFPVLGKLHSSITLIADNTNSAWWVIGSNRINAPHTWKSIATGDSPYAVTDVDEVIKADTSGGNIEIDLPATTNRDGRRIRIERPSASNTLTLDPDGTEQIDGAGAGTAVTLAAAAGNWWEYQVANGEWKRVGGRF